MRKLILLFSFMLISGLTALAQPSGFSYQAIIRTPSGEIVANRDVNIRISILTGSTNVVPDYAEEHKTRTNSIGLVNLVVGEGNSSSNIEDIDWSTGPKFLGLAVDVNGGSNFVVMGATEIQSVPYALYAANGGASGSAGPVGPEGPQGEKGEKGDRGEAGPQGNDGEKGQDGTSVVIKGSIENEALLDPDYSGDIGDIFIVEESGEAFLWNNEKKWVSIGQIKGPKGDDGERGPIGETGQQGEDGEAGQDGTGIKIIGVLATIAELPTNYNGSVGDILIITENDFGYSWTGSEWVAIGQLRGPQGLAGSEGPEGAQGPEGSQGPQGAKGDPGEKGETGNQGEKGEDGTSVRIVGTVIDEDALNLNYSGPAGDILLAEDTGIAYVWDGSKWTNIGQIKGPQGDLGPIGPQGDIGSKGDRGAQGVTGPQGDTGPQGANGSRGPTGDQGIQGNTGPQGDQGDNGPQGDQGIQGPQGIQGIQGVKGDQGDKGEDGTSVRIVGTVPSESGLDLDYSGDTGDIFIAEDTGTAYVWDGAKWTNIGAIKGPKGDKGEQGDTGAQGSVGPQGIQGEIGPQGIKGDQGGLGPQGPQGIAGANGTDGTDGIDGANGDNGDTYLTKVTPEPAGSNCPEGGLKLEGGIDDNKDGTLSAGEVDDTQYICDGKDGTDGVDGAIGSDGKTTLTKVTTEAAGANCTYGGQKIEVGLDDNEDGILQSGEVVDTQYVCDGKDGTDGVDGTIGSDGKTTLTRVTTEAAGANCTYGGQKIEVGLDDNEDGILQSGEVVDTQYVCDGKDGTDGVDGTIGSDGKTTLTKVTTEAAGANCTYGGQKIEVGLDDNEDGILQLGEVDDTQYVCDGKDGTDGTDGAVGTDGKTWLTTSTLEPKEANCSEGGIRIDSGLDENGNGSLESGEIQETSYVCNGQTGTNGTDGQIGDDGRTPIITSETVPIGSALCPELNGGKEIEIGYDNNSDGDLNDPGDEILDRYYICNGGDGEPGAAGPQGPAGSSGGGGFLVAFKLDYADNKYDKSYDQEGNVTVGSFTQTSPGICDSENTDVLNLTISGESFNDSYFVDINFASPFVGPPPSYKFTGGGGVQIVFCDIFGDFPDLSITISQ